jgi:dephospho-CoA kinase
MKSLKPHYHRLTPSERLYQLDSPIIGLTGGIASGKSTVVKLMKSRGLKVIDADQLVKTIYQQDETKNFIQSNYPEAWHQGAIDFSKLRELFFQDAKTKQAIESHIYSKLPEAFKAAAPSLTEQRFYLYDVPLLYEKGLDSRFDLTIVVYAPREMQLARLLSRDNNELELANKILNQQMDIEEKKIKADFVIDNSAQLSSLAAEVDSLLLQILN